MIKTHDSARVLHIITSLETGGAERMLVKLLEASKAGDLEHHVLCLGPSGALAGVAQRAAASVSFLNVCRDDVSLFEAFRQLRSVTREVAPTIVQGWMYHGNIAALAAVLAVRPSATLFWNIRHSLSDLRHEKPRTRRLIRLAGHLSYFPRAIIYNSRASAAQHEAMRYARSKSIIIPNCFDAGTFRPDRRAGPRLRSELGVSRAVAIIGNVARWHPMKDHQTFLLAFRNAVAQNASLHAVLVGRGVDSGNKALTGAIDELGLEGRVSLLGERRDVAALIPGFDLLCVSSAWGEAFPNVIGESLACGVPVVATDVGDCASLLDGIGAVAAPRDAKALAEAMLRMLNLAAEERKAIRERGIAKVRTLYSVERVAGTYARLYQCRLPRRGGGA